MKDILSMTLSELKEAVASLGEKPYRAGQIFEWLHDKRVTDFSEMTTLSKSLREKLSDGFEIFSPKIERVLESAHDGTRKYLFKLHDGETVESVLMRYEHGLSVCISSQVGCAMGCRFCASTVGGKKRDLLASEILSQVYAVSREAGERIGSVVVMGIGEPFDNYDNLIGFLSLITDEKGYNMSARSITISTCGLIPGIDALSESGFPVTLAVSLHASDQEKRKALMPVASKYEMGPLLAACGRYFDRTGRRVTFEYALIEGKNDSDEDAAELCALLGKMNCHVNLIPVNPAREGMVRPGKAAVYAFQKKLTSGGINATVRRTLGEDIDGACGQLRGKYSGERGSK